MGKKEGQERWKKENKIQKRRKIKKIKKKEDRTEGTSFYKRNSVEHLVGNVGSIR